MEDMKPVAISLTKRGNILKKS